MQRILKWACWTGIAAIVAVAASAALGGTIPLIAIAGHFAFYAVFLGLGLAAAGWAIQDARICVAALMAFGINAAIVSSMGLGPRAPDPADQAAKILLFNIRWDNQKLDEVVALVTRSDADVVVFQEVYRGNRDGLRPLDAIYPYRVECWQSGYCDTLILSRKSLRDPFVAKEWNGTRLDFARVEFDIGRCPVTMFTAHLTRPWPYRTLASSAAQFRQAAAFAHAVREWPGAKIVVGDLNATTWSPVVRDMARAVRGSALRGWSGTWPWFLPGFLKLPIDQVIVSHPQISARREVLGPTGSDHSPVLATLSVECGR